MNSVIKQTNKKKSNQNKNSKYILENILNKAIKLLILVITLSKTHFLDHPSFLGDLSPTETIMLYMKIEK